MKLPTKIVWSDVSDSKNVRRVLMVLVILIIVLGVFKLGEVVGYRRAQFAGRFGDSFDRNFNGFSGAPPGSMPRELLPPGGHGALGIIASIALPNIIVADRDGLEKTIHISSTTDIREFRYQIASTSLTVGESVIVLGMPGDAGQIEATLVRVLPSQSSASAAPTHSAPPTP